MKSVCVLVLLLHWSIPGEQVGSGERGAESGDGRKEGGTELSMVPVDAEPGRTITGMFDSGART
jgi:hypothetical protein